MNATAASPVKPSLASEVPILGGASYSLSSRMSRYIGALSIAVALHGILFLLAIQQSRKSSVVAPPPIPITLLLAPTASTGAASSSISDSLHGQAKPIEEPKKPSLTTVAEPRKRTSRQATAPKTKVPRTAPSVSRSAPAQPHPKSPPESQLSASVSSPDTATPAPSSSSGNEGTIQSEGAQMAIGAPGNSQQANESSTNAAGDGRSGYGSAATGNDLLPANAVAYPPRLVFQVKAEYPARARSLGVEGLVRLKAILDREGRIERNIQVLESVPLLDEAALSSVRQWRFTPARNHSRQPVRVFLEIPIQFVLHW